MARERSFTHLAPFYQGTFDMTVAGDGTPHVARGTLVGPALLETLGVRPAIGRPFGDADAITGAPDVVMLTWAAWQREFGGDRRAIGRTMLIEGKTYEVIGVLPA